MLSVLGYMNNDDGIDITRHGWDQTFFCVCVNLKEASQRSCNTTVGNMVSVDFKFKAPLPENIRILCYSMYDNECRINQPLKAVPNKEPWLKL